MDASARVANCLICTLAAVMRDCPRCAFNAGLAVKALATQAECAKENTVLSLQAEPKENVISNPVIMSI